MIGREAEDNRLVLTWRMAQGVTMMMNISDTALRDLTTLAVVSASRLSLMGRLATEEPSNIGSADSSMCLMINCELWRYFELSLHLFFILSFCEW